MVELLVDNGNDKRNTQSHLGLYVRFDFSEPLVKYHFYQDCPFYREMLGNMLRNYMEEDSLGLVDYTISSRDITFIGFGDLVETYLSLGLDLGLNVRHSKLTDVPRSSEIVFRIRDEGYLKDRLSMSLESQDYRSLDGRKLLKAASDFIDYRYRAYLQRVAPDIYY